MQRKNALDALPERDLSHRESRPRPAAADRDDHALEDLDPLLLAFTNLDMDTHRQSRSQIRAF